MRFRHFRSRVRIQSQVLFPSVICSLWNHEIPSSREELFAKALRDFGLPQGQHSLQTGLQVLWAWAWFALWFILSTHTSTHPPVCQGTASHQFTTNKQFSKTSISVFTNTHNCLYIWNSQYEVCRNRPCCELHNFRIFPVSYATTPHNQAVNNPDLQLHCTIKNTLNYCCQKWTVPHKENCTGAKNLSWFWNLSICKWHSFH